MRDIRMIVPLFALGALFFLGSCTDSSNDKPVTEVDTLVTDTLPLVQPADTIVAPPKPSATYILTQNDKAILELLQSIEMGLSFNEVKARYPSLKGIRPEDKKDELAAAGYTESVCRQALFGSEASAEFNFKDDSLYAYIFVYNEQNSEKVEKVFQAVKNYYSTKWGPPIPEMIEEENHYNQSFVWTGEHVIPFLSYNLNTNTIAWGKRYEKSL